MRNRLPRGHCVLLIFLVGWTITAALLSVLLGSAEIPTSHIVQIILDSLKLPNSGAWHAWEQIAVLQIRLPRTVMAVFVGGSLAVAGAAMQGLFRNPLASPTVLGVSSGASLGAVIAIYSGMVLILPWSLPLLAFAGGLLTAYIVYVLATERGQISIPTLLLAGVAMSSLNVAFTSFILSLALDNYEVGKQIVFWTLGGLDGQTWDQALVVLPVLFVGLGVTLISARDLDALAVGELHAASVGVDVKRARRQLLFSSSLVAAAAVAAAGAVGFVGLVVPHIMRLLVGARHALLLPASLLGGSAFVLTADIIARIAVRPEELRLGTITAAVGAPFFLFLLVTHSRRKH